jgi:hypothetical protein
MPLEVGHQLQELSGSVPQGVTLPLHGLGATVPGGDGGCFIGASHFWANHATVPTTTLATHDRLS